MKKYLGALFVSLLLCSCSSSKGGRAEEGKAHETALGKSLGVDADSFVEGNLFFLAYHELGHAAVSEFDLPVIGREEDAVDRLAIWMMTPDEDEGEPDYLIGAMHGWFISATETPLANIPWWDAHSSDQQRGYQIACVLYGSDPKRFEKAASSSGIPDDSLESCVEDARLNTQSWDRVLAPHQRGDDSQARADSVVIRYEDSEDYADDAAYLKSIGVLENVAEIIKSDYVFEPGIVLVGKDCGEANSYWSPSDRTLTMCYELVGEYRAMAASDDGA